MQVHPIHAEKPDKFYIKFRLAFHVKSNYVVIGFPYSGKDEMRPIQISQDESVVLQLIEPFTGSDKSVATDNIFTGQSLGTMLLQKKKSLAGTILHNKRELPKFAERQKDKMQRFTTQFYVLNNCTLTIYKSNPNKNVLLLRSRHTSVTTLNICQKTLNFSLARNLGLK